VSADRIDVFAKRLRTRLEAAYQGDEDRARSELYGSPRQDVTPLGPDHPKRRAPSMSSEQPTPTMNPAQATELARLVDEHKPDLVALPRQRFPGQPMVITFLMNKASVEWVIDTDGESWLADRAMRGAA
jgi:hypothetical protein